MRNKLQSLKKSQSQKSSPMYEPAVYVNVTVFFCTTVK